MAPTEILANQHYQLAKKLFKKTNVNLNILTGKTNYKEKIKFYQCLKIKYKFCFWNTFFISKQN